MIKQAQILSPLRDFLHHPNLKWPRGRTEFLPALSSSTEAWLQERLAGDSLTQEECMALPEYQQMVLCMLMEQHYHHLLKALIDPTPYLQDTSKVEIGTLFLRYLLREGWLY